MTYLTNFQEWADEGRREYEEWRTRQKAERAKKPSWAPVLVLSATTLIFMAVVAGAFILVAQR